MHQALLIVILFTLDNTRRFAASNLFANAPFMGDCA